MAEKNKTDMTFLEHLEELRWHLIRSVSAVLVLSVVAFLLRDLIFDQILLAPKNPCFITNDLLCRLADKMNIEEWCINQKSFQLINLNLTGQFNTHIMVSIVAGFIVGFPYIFWEFWRFIEPALKETEKSHAQGTVFFISILFLLGIAFGYFLVVPMTLDFFGSYHVSNDVTNQINLSSYISTVVTSSLGCGILFEIPVLVYFFTKIGLLTPQLLQRFWRHAIVGILIIAAIIAPPDIFSMVLVSIPLFILYEVGILISKRIVKQKAKKELIG
jgi:sec-independent protein translocase protein TatC